MDRPQDGYWPDRTDFGQNSGPTESTLGQTSGQIKPTEDDSSALESDQRNCSDFCSSKHVLALIINAHLDLGTVCPDCSFWPMVWKTFWPTVWTMLWPKVCSVWPLILTTVWRMVWPTVWTRVWRRVSSIWPMDWTMSGQSGQWCPKSVQSGQWWPTSARSGQYLSLGIVGPANTCLGSRTSSWALNKINIVLFSITVGIKIRRIASNSAASIFFHTLMTFFGYTPFGYRTRNGAEITAGFLRNSPPLHPQSLKLKSQRR